MAQFTVLTPLNHDGHSYEPGAVVELTGKQAATLLRVAAIKKQPDCGVEVKVSDENSESAVATNIATAIPRLDPTNPSQWTRDGRPRTETLAAIIGRRVSALERDRIWQQWIEENGS
jgi:hypothetical protein